MKTNQSTKMPRAGKNSKKTQTSAELVESIAAGEFIEEATQAIIDETSKLVIEPTVESNETMPTMAIEEVPDMKDDPELADYPELIEPAPTIAPVVPQTIGAYARRLYITQHPELGLRKLSKQWGVCIGTISYDRKQIAKGEMGKV